MRRLNGMRSQLQELENTYLQLTAEYENLQSDIDRAEEKIQIAYTDRTQLTSDIETLQNKIVSAEQDNADVTAKIAVCSNEIQHSTDRIAALEQQRSELSDSGESWEQKLAEQDEYIAELLNRQTALEQKLTDAQNALTALDEQYDKQVQSVTEQDGSLRKKYLRQSELRVQLQNSEQAITETQESMERADADGSAVASRMQDHAKQKQSLEKQIAAVEKKREEQQNRLAGCRQLAALKEQKYQQATEAARNIASEYAQVRQRQQILRDLEQNMEGYAGSVKQIVKAAGSGRLGGVHGTVSQKITVEPQYGTAIETALGGALQNIIVENDETAKRCMRYLKETRGGRATFLPLTTIRGGRLNERLDGVEGFVALACDLIGYDPIYKNIMEQLLGRIAVAEDLDSASRIAKQFGYRIRLVTLDGQVIHAGGSFTGGSAARSAGVITRTHELEETAERMKQLAAEQTKLEEDANKRKAEWAKLLTDVEGAQALITELDGQHRELQQQLAAAEARAASDAAWQENEAAERKRLEEKLTELTRQKTETQQALDTLTAEITAAEDTLHEDSIEQARLHSEQEMQSKQIADDRIRQAELQKDIEIERKRRISMAQSMEQAGEQAAQLLEDLKRERGNIAAKQHEIEVLQSGQEQSKKDREEMQTKIGQLRHDMEEKEQYARLLNESMKELRDAREKQSAERTRAEERKNTVQKDVDDLIFRLQDAYELTCTEAEAEAQPIENIREAESQLASLKGKIRALGTVNVAAVDEYKEVSARYQDMTGQLADIEKAKKELEALIAQLTENMCDIFRKSFVKINEYFGQIFVELFGGGSASLELTDPEHILESGIEIKVAPPGKVIKNLISLSGGEQSFVAICIYFAILKLRPAPFCILDEIDAALDEVNVHKYAQYLKNFFGKVQFVVVTHRRSAMDAANVLYGVTMQEDGISRLLRLDQNGVAVEEAEKAE